MFLGATIWAPKPVYQSSKCPGYVTGVDYFCVHPTMISVPKYHLSNDNVSLTIPRYCFSFSFIIYLVSRYDMPGKWLQMRLLFTLFFILFNFYLKILGSKTDVSNCN